jgi:GT2 family glycosyltransferase
MPPQTNLFGDLKIVVLNWNLKEDTLSCLDSLLRANIFEEQIILIDNGSTDGSVEAFQERYNNHIHLVSNKDNRGYVEGVNQGVKLALDQGAEWILLINNDTIVAEDFFQCAAAELKKISFAIFGPIIYYHDDPDRVWFLGARLIPGTLLTTGLNHNKTHFTQEVGVLPVDFISGCAMFVHRDVFRDIGLLDPILVMYGEEVDFCWRARLAGFQIACLPQVRMWHKVSQSAKRVRSFTHYLKIRNQNIFYRRYSRGLQLPVMFTYSFFRTIIIFLKVILYGQKDLIFPSWYGFYDGWVRPISSPTRQL